MPAGAAAAALVILVLTQSPLAGAGEAGGAEGDGADAGPEPAERAEPICLAEVADARGLPSMVVLVGFEDGVYRVRTREGREVELPEGGVSSVRLAPLPERPGPGVSEKGPKRPPGDEREDAMRAALPPGTVGRLMRLAREGGLEEHLRSRSSELRGARSAREAVGLIAEIVTARRIDRRPLRSDDLRRLVGSIEDPAVREEVRKNRAIHWLLRARERPDRRPRGPGGRRNGDPRRDN